MNYIKATCGSTDMIIIENCSHKEHKLAQISEDDNQQI
jgi:hypothetical protein